jgi:PAS domain S-box-containing protein
MRDCEGDESAHVMNKLKQVSIGNQVLFAFGTLCLVLVMIGTLFVYSLRTIEHRRQTQQARAHQRWETIGDVAKNVGLMQTEVLQHVFVTNAGEMKRRDQTIRELDAANTRILADYSAFVDSERESVLYARVVHARTVYLERTEELLVLSRVNRNIEAADVALAKQSPAYLEYHGVADEMIGEAEASARQSRADTSRLIRQLGKNGGVLIGLAILITLGTGFAVVKVTRRLRADNEILQTEITERTQMEKRLREKERLLSESQRLGHVGSWFYDMSGPISWSEELYRLYGVSPETFIPTVDAFTGLIYPDDRPGLQAWMTNCAAGKATDQYEFRIVMHDGTIRYMRGSGEGTFDAENRLVYMAGTVQDISEQKRAEQLRSEHDARYRAIFDAALDITYVLDEHGNFAELSPSFEKVTGWSAADWIGRSYSDLLHPDHVEKAAAIFRKALAGVPVGAFELRMRKSSGEYWDAELNITRLAASGVLQVLGVAHDITERKRAGEEREKFIALIENSADFIGMATLEGKPFFVNKAGRKLVGLEPDCDVSSTSISDYFDSETAALLENTGIPETFATGGWVGGGNLRNFTTHALIPVHMHSILVRDQETGEPICLATVQRNITDIKEAEKRLERVHRELLDMSRLSGMAEIATSVLHNVGNVLNSVNVSSDRISEKVKRLRPANLVKVAALLREHMHDLPDFLARDNQGKELPGYLLALVDQMADPQKDILSEVVSLRKNIEHIREIVRMQQNYARGTNVQETIALSDLVEDAIRINAAGLTRHAVQLIREFSPVPPFPVEKHKVLQILVNLLNNAKYALDAGSATESKLTVRVERNGGGTAKISVIDNGVGIAAENLNRIFQHGFTTRKDGHGFGLHSGALAAKELGGSLTAYSEGEGRGATFTLELPTSDSGAGQ